MKSFYEMTKIIEAVATAPGASPTASTSASNPTPGGVQKPTEAQKSQNNATSKLTAGAQQAVQAAQDVAAAAQKKAEEEAAKKRSTVAADFIKRYKALFTNLAKTFGIQARF